MPTPSIIVITGATNGLGYEAAAQLLRQGVQLVLTARSKQRAATAEQQLKELAPGAKVDFFFGDLSSMSDVRRLGTEIHAAYPRIDALINNAGLHGFAQRVTSEGLPEMIAVNYLAPWLLTHTLLPSLMNNETARVVNVASEASRNHGELRLPYDLTDTSDFTRIGSSKIYGKTKLLNIMFTEELARQLDGSGITVNALNPGFNVTGLGRELGFAPLLAKILKFMRIGDPKRGADIIVRLASDVQYQGITGGYYNVGTGKPLSPAYPGCDRAMQTRLWEATRELLARRGFL